MLKKENILDALRECYDPEIPINVVDLGLIYDIRINGDRVEIDMTLTAPGCPMHVPISADVKEKVEAVEGVKDAQVYIVWEPAWTPARMSETAKKSLGFR